MSGSEFIVTCRFGLSTQIPNQTRRTHGLLDVLGFQQIKNHVTRQTCSIYFCSAPQASNSSADWLSRRFPSLGE